MFSIETGTPIAIIKGGPHDGAVLGTTHLADEKGLGADIELKEGTFLPFIRTDGERTVEFIAGPSGAGKSTYLAGLLSRHLKLNPKAPIVLFSRGRAEDDPAFEPLLKNMGQAELNQELVDNPPDVTGMQPGTILVFDDCGTIFDDEIRGAVEKLIQDTMEVGRKAKVHCLVTSHAVSPPGKKHSAVVKQESHFVTLFPGSGSAMQALGYLKNHLGLTPKQAQALLAVKSRWVRIHTCAPRYAMYEGGVYML